MLKFQFLLLSLLLMATSSLAQINVDKSSLPAVGDSLRTVTDPLPPLLDLGHLGGENNWNFSALQGISSEEIVFDAEASAKGALFPDANLLISRAEGTDSYLSTKGDQQLLIGLANADPANLKFRAAYTFDPPYIEKNTPLAYDDLNKANASIKIQVPAEELSEAILDQLSTVEIDSIRLEINFERADEVDAWGNLTIPNGTYEVLREKRIEYKTSKLEILSFLGWIDVTLLAASEFPALARDTSTSYYFWSADAKIPVAKINVNPNNEQQIVSASYLADSLPVDIPYVSKDRKDLIAFPNPAIDKVRFSFRNLPADNYDLVIFNILGQKLWSQTYYVAGNHTVAVDITNLRKGTYLYSLMHNKDKTLVTKRLMVIRP